VSEDALAGPPKCQAFRHAAGRFDLPGFVLAGLGFPLVMYAFNAGPGEGWAAPGILAAIVAGLVLLADAAVTMAAPAGCAPAGSASAGSASAATGL
jgi:hypothetical protein